MVIPFYYCYHFDYCNRTVVIIMSFHAPLSLFVTSVIPLNSFLTQVIRFKKKLAIIIIDETAITIKMT